MIAAVIADDLSGAAELAGAAAGLGFTAEVHTSFDATSDAEVIAVDTDSRAIPPADAAAAAAGVARQILPATPAWVFKKTDSVLRGNVRAEIEGILCETGLSGALLVPANPSMGRVIRDGVYYLNGVSLAQTAFASDPHHPRTSSVARELLGESEGRVDRIVLPDVPDADALSRLAARLTAATLPAGGVEFFRAVLASRAGRRSTPPEPARLIRRPTLIVCGSPQAWRDGRPIHCVRHGIDAMVLPKLSGARADWAKHVVSALNNTGCVMLATGDAPTDFPQQLARQLAEAAADVVRRSPISSVCVEGGATAAAVFAAMGWTRLTALPSAQYLGVAALRPLASPEVTVFVKPGSYPWPEAIWSDLKAEACS